jgi:nucleotide-binding universal stress UspA family protein
METIVVGVDGSKGASAALEFAADEAALRGARILVVSAWEVPASLYDGGGMVMGADPSTFEAFQEQAQAIVDGAVASVQKRRPTVECEGRTVQGRAAPILLEEASEASLIVVGSRGLGGFKSLLLGSVSQQVVQHAPCPVVVVRGADPQSS